MAVQIEGKPSATSAAADGSRLSVELRKSWKSPGNEGFTLDVDFAVLAGITILFGASGSGKTTLLDCVAGLTAPDRGRIEAGERVFYDSQQGVSLSSQRRGTGYVFQDLALFPHLTVEQNVDYGLHGFSGPEQKKEQKKRISDILERFRIAHLRERRPREVSGGERQRVALARSLVTDPCVLLLDEPLSGLDAPTRSLLLDDLRAWNQAHAIPVLYVTHSREEVFALGERVIVLDKGRVLADGSPQGALGAPRHETVAELTEVENVFDATVAATHEEQGTMSCQLGAGGVPLEVPLGRQRIGERVRIGIRAGDILLANTPPQGLSARNVLHGRIESLERRDVMVIAQVDCGLTFEVHLTPSAVQSLLLAAESPVWLVIKTYSCHLLAKS